MKMEQTECSETSAFKIQTPGNNPKESIQHSVFMQGTNLLSYYLCDFVLYFNAIYVLLIIAFDSVTTPHFVN